MTSVRKQYFLRIIALAFALALGAPAVNAVPVVIQDNNVAVAILDLEVGGTLYNVNFEYDVWPDIYSNPPVFPFDLTLAEEANEKINLALNLADVKQVGPPQEGRATEGFPLYAIGVTLDDSEGYVGWIGAGFVDNIDVWIDDYLGTPIGGYQFFDQHWMWADFEVVPVPAAVWLFGSALGVLGWLRRKSA